MKCKYTLDSKYLSSGCGIRKLVSLGLGGGIFGIIARNNINTNDSAEAMLWVSVFAWVTTFIFYVYRAHGKVAFTACGEFYYSLVMTISYIVTTVFWGVYNTFPLSSPANRRGLLVFILAILICVNYLEQTIWSGIASYKSYTKSDPPAEGAVNEAVVENGKAEEAAEQTEQKSAD
ncbi:unnamed protein product [Clavelina lepadiformis]|uniref:MARVEL domain-containing protein n=1 Tax=Clavelina lepadiformis TaxID=159417 RepID=A0ABP0F7M5_CLALP